MRNFVQICFWLTGLATNLIIHSVANITDFYYAQGQTICQLQNQIGRLNRLLILNKLQILPGRLNEIFRPNSVRFWLADLATNNS